MYVFFESIYYHADVKLSRLNKVTPLTRCGSRKVCIHTNPTRPSLISSPSGSYSISRSNQTRTSIQTRINRLSTQTSTRSHTGRYRPCRRGRSGGRSSKAIYRDSARSTSGHYPDCFYFKWRSFTAGRAEAEDLGY